MIAHEGPITLERYMSLCLGHPRYGYYMTRDPFGASGDFITAPEISQMFGELLGLWASEAWRAAGAPVAGAARRTRPRPRHADVRRAARRAHRAGLFSPRSRCISSRRARCCATAQRQTLASAAKPVAWQRGRRGSRRTGPAIILANEFFDALPVRHFVQDARAAGASGLSASTPTGELAFGLADADRAGAHRRRRAKARSSRSARSRQRLMSDIAARLVARGRRAARRRLRLYADALGESLQAVTRHAYVDPLASAGRGRSHRPCRFRRARAAPRAPRGAKVHGSGDAGRISCCSSASNGAREALSKKATPEQAQAIIRRFRTADRRGRSRAATWASSSR